MNARLEARLLAMGVCESITYCTGRTPAPHKPRTRMAAYVGGYALLLFVVGAVLALAAR
jgi:hypothetical protein